MFHKFLDGNTRTTDKTFEHIECHYFILRLRTYNDISITFKHIALFKAGKNPTKTQVVNVCESIRKKGNIIKDWENKSVMKKTVDNDSHFFKTFEDQS